jgi:hypothetical protein
LPIDWINLKIKILGLEDKVEELEHSDKDKGTIIKYE